MSPSSLRAHASRRQGERVISVRAERSRRAKGDALRVFVAALAILAACGGRSTQPGRVADAAAPPRAAFEVYPDAEIAGVKSPHLYKGKALCQRCHFPDLKLTAEPI